jgi:hypothetical protein
MKLREWYALANWPKSLQKKSFESLRGSHLVPYDRLLPIVVMMMEATKGLPRSRPA